VPEGIVFIDGIAETEAHREWAGQVARTIQDVVAVVNRIEVQARVDWDLTPAWAEARGLVQQGQRVLPLLLLASIVLIPCWLAARLVTRLARVLLARWIETPLLLKVLARAIGIPVLLLGLYLVLQFAGLTRLAVTVLGGTGLIGLAIGFVFRDIAENFLTSLLLSIRNPFNSGDFIEIGAFGKTFDKTQVVAALLNETPREIAMSNFSVRALADDLALATYRARINANTSLRSSLW